MATSYTEFDFSMVSGETKYLVVTILQEGTTTARNITNDLFTWTLRPKNGGASLASYSIGSGITLTTPASGILTVTLSAAATTAQAGEYTHELRMTASTGEITVPVRGVITIVRGLT
jgi:hypothetical protein